MSSKRRVQGDGVQRDKDWSKLPEDKGIWRGRREKGRKSLDEKEGVRGDVGERGIGGRRAMGGKRSSWRRVHKGGPQSGNPSGERQGTKCDVQ